MVGQETSSLVGITITATCLFRYIGHPKAIGMCYPPTDGDEVEDLYELLKEAKVRDADFI